jgi:hypothetical protein
VKVYREDEVELEAPQQLASGTKIVACRAMRAGLLTYNEGNRTVVELRTPEENAKATAKLRGVPITDMHVDARAPVDGAIGHILSAKVDGQWTKVELALSKRPSGRAASLGYACTRAPADPSLFEKYGRHDYLQTDIEPHHLALGNFTARAGAAAVARLDSDGNSIAEENTDMTDLEKLKKERDELAGRLAVLESKPKADSTVENFDAKVAARAALLVEARGVLGANERMDSKTDAEIRRAVVGKLCGTVKLDGQSAAFVDGAYAAAMALTPRTMSPAEQVRAGVVSVIRRDTVDDPTATARAKMIERLRRANVRHPLHGVDPNESRADGAPADPEAARAAMIQRDLKVNADHRAAAKKAK